MQILNNITTTNANNLFRQPNQLMSLMRLSSKQPTESRLADLAKRPRPQYNLELKRDRNDHILIYKKKKKRTEEYEICFSSRG